MVSIEMPKYKCHKEVWALKIKDITETDSVANIVKLHFENQLYAPIEVNPDWYYKHKPKVGGYYVVYKDGYSSFSPAEAFEDGYTLVNKGE